MSGALVLSHWVHYQVYHLCVCLSMPRLIGVHPRWVSGFAATSLSEALSW